MIVCARWIASCAFVRCSTSTARAASFVADRDLTSCCSCESRCRASCRVRTFFCASIAPIRIVAGGVELAASDVVGCREERHAVFGRLDRRIRLQLQNLLLRLRHLGFGLRGAANSWSAGSISKTISPALTEVPVESNLTSRSVPPAGGTTKVAVRPARNLARGEDGQLQRAASDPRGRQPIAPLGEGRGHGEQERRRSGDHGQTARPRSTDGRFTAASESDRDPDGASRSCRRAATPGADRDLLPAAPGHFDALFVEHGSAQPVDDRPAVALKDRLGGSNQRVRWARSIAMRAVAVIPGRILGSGSFSTSPRSKFLGGGHPWLRIDLAREPRSGPP